MKGGRRPTPGQLGNLPVQRRQSGGHLGVGLVFDFLAILVAEAPHAARTRREKRVTGLRELVERQGHYEVATRCAPRQSSQPAPKSRKPRKDSPSVSQLSRRWT